MIPNDKNGKLPLFSTDTEENYEFMELNGTAAYVKYNRFHIEHRPQYVPDPFRSENFYYNEDEY